MSYVRPLGPIVPNAGTYEVFSCPNCAYAQIQVQNGAVDYSIAQGDSTMQSTFSVPDDTLLPGSGPILGPLQAIRFKARAPVSNPAPQVSIRAEKALPLGGNIAPAWTPSYVTIAGDGSISANFSGHVAAKGIDLPLPIGPSADDKIRWLRGDGSTGALLQANDTGTGTIQDLSASRDNNVSVDLLLTADTAGVSSLKATVARADVPFQKSLNIITLNAAGDAMASDFLQLFANQNAKLKWGKIANFFGGTVAANTVAVGTPTAAQLGFPTTILTAFLSLQPTNTADSRLISHDVVTPNCAIVTGATVQTYDMNYIAIGN